MVKVYAVALAAGLVGLVAVIIATTIDTRRATPSSLTTTGERARALLGGLIGFGMGGMSSEFSPLDLDWPLALAIAVVAGGLSALWAHRGGGEGG